MTDDNPRALHRALGDARRVRIVDELRAERGGLDASQLAERLGLHANTIRFHLGVLTDAGLVTSKPLPRETPGRPRIVYSLLPATARDVKEEYRFLATMLAGTVSTLDDATERSREAGRAWGRYLVRRPLPLARTSDDDAAEEVARLLDEQGFAPERDGVEIVMHRCPYHDLAETHPDVLCSLHHGLISGALDELGSDLEVADLQVFPTPSTCLVRLAPRAAAGQHT